MIRCASALLTAVHAVGSKSVQTLVCAGLCCCLVGSPLEVVQFIYVGLVIDDVGGGDIGAGLALGRLVCVLLILCVLEVGSWRRAFIALMYWQALIFY